MLLPKIRLHFPPTPPHTRATAKIRPTSRAQQRELTLLISHAHLLPLAYLVYGGTYSSLYSRYPSIMPPPRRIAPGRRPAALPGGGARKKPQPTNSKAKCCDEPDIQDRDGAIPLLQASRRSFPFVENAFADAAYAADRVANATCIAIEIVRKPPGQVGFAVHPRRWVVERCFAWLNRNRRLAKDFEATIASATTFLYAASVMLLTRRLARCT